MPRAAEAHTRLSGSTPAAGATVGDSLREVRLSFSTRVSPRLTTLALVLAGDTVAGGETVAVEGTDGREVAFLLPATLRPGTYLARWRTAGADGHAIHGEFTFTVEGDSAGVAPVAAPVAPAPMPPADDGETKTNSATLVPVVVRWAGFVALLGMIGAVAFNLVVLRRLGGSEEMTPVVDRAAYGVWYLAAGAAALSALTLVLRLWIQSAALSGPENAFDGDRLDALLRGSVWGAAWTLQAVATAAFFLGLMVARAPHGRTVGWYGAAVAAVLAAAVPALSGHAAAEERLTGLAITIDTLHVLGAGVWLGTLCAVLGAGAPAAASAGDGKGMAAFAAMVRGFSPVALAAAGLAGATGIGNALFHISAPSQLWSTSYGLVLLLKIAVLAVVAGLGFFNWRFVLPGVHESPAAGRIRRTAGMEIAAGLAVVLVTAVLVALPTP